MNVEQEYFFFASFRFVQRRRRWSGTAFHRAGEIGVDDNRVGAMRALGGANADGAFAGEEDLFDGLVQADFHAQPFGHAGHRGGEGGAAADGMKDAVFVFQEGKNREQARTAERRHAEIFRLKAKRQAHTVVGEESFQVGIHRLMRTQHGEHLEQAGLHQVLPAQEGAFQARLHERELGAVLVEETAEAGSVIRRKRGNLPLHRRYVRRAVQFAARPELDPVLRIQPHHFDFGAEAGSGGLEDFLQHAG